MVGLWRLTLSHNGVSSTPRHERGSNSQTESTKYFTDSVSNILVQPVESRDVITPVDF
jgi:hypothetical protein